MRSLATTVVLLHTLILIGHDFAHRSLDVGLSSWELVYAYTIIVATPLMAALLVFTRYARTGFALLAFSMLGALAFGVYHHYVLISPDHVSHLPAGDTQGLFRVTAAFMALVQAAGAALGVLGWRKQMQ